jgi:hypothetical protein
VVSIRVFISGLDCGSLWFVSIAGNVIQSCGFLCV